ncbi:LysR family transcriptional regulator [Phreatobacter stygius]|uniref:LysR family transcriptional regulator n=1 Tax=Phreatobacter stygius TaxID=1940610 RepID=A0A4D7AUK3_9HYPH|nr:LysR family transcriptional regulator [Phreatobacter stygius]QCI63341.1 LysR family transcriptional regulator [Phreatobacter stygius]
MAPPRISLEQWRALAAVVEAGGYAQAAVRLNKTQSTISYAVRQIEQRLGVTVFEIAGRRAVLSASGQVLYRRGRALIDEAERVEKTADNLARGQEAELNLAVEILFPTWLLLRCLECFAAEQPETRIELHESMLGGTDELLAERRVDLAVCTEVPPGFTGDRLAPVRFIAAAAPFHPLHQLGRPLTMNDLRDHRHLVIRDSGIRRTRPAAWLVTERRLTVSHKATSIRAACMGLGFAWYAESIIKEELECGALKALPLVEGAERWGALFLVYADPDAASPGVRRLGRIISDAVGGMIVATPTRGPDPGQGPGAAPA